MTCAWAFVVYDGEEELYRLASTEVPAGAEQHWNIAGECCAVVRAVEWLKLNNIDAATIHHDYIGLGKWPTGEWKAKTDFTKWYRSYIFGCDVDLNFVWVKGHSGDKRNDVVDKLAYNIWKDVENAGYNSSSNEANS